MAITKCRECGRRISTNAATCPGCGAVVRARTVAGTSQRIKRQMLIGWLCCGIGAITWLGGCQMPAGQAASVVATLGGVLSLGGFGIVVCARQAAWWHHG